MQAALDDEFATFMRAMQVFVEAQYVTISTSPTYSMFGDHSQNAPISTDNTAVTPQSYIISGCIRYGNTQPWPDFSATRSAAQGGGQLKLKDSEGLVRIKVNSDGYDILKDVKLINLDGFQFQLDSTPRPHGLLGNPSRWTFQFRKLD